MRVTSMVTKEDFVLHRSSQKVSWECLTTAWATSALCNYTHCFVDLHTKWTEKAQATSALCKYTHCFVDLHTKWTEKAQATSALCNYTLFCKQCEPIFQFTMSTDYCIFWIGMAIIPALQHLRSKVIKLFKVRRTCLSSKLFCHMGAYLTCTQNSQIQKTSEPELFLQIVILWSCVKPGSHKLEGSTRLTKS
jgi:hypothetical protein